MKPIDTRPRRRRPRLPLADPSAALAAFLAWFLVFTVLFGWIAPGFFDAIFPFIGDLGESGRRLFF